MIALVQDNNDLAYVLEKFLEMEHIDATSFPSMLHFNLQHSQGYEMLVVSSDSIIKVGLSLEMLLGSPIPTIVTTAYDEVADWCNEHDISCLLLPFTLHRFLKFLHHSQAQILQA